MMPVKAIARTVYKSVGDNSPTILTAVAVAGVISTAFLAVRATPEALRRIEKERARLGKEDMRFTVERANEIPYVDLSAFGVIKVTWRGYIPAMTMGLATVTCIIGANTVSTKRNAAMISAYSLTDQAFREYREKVASTFGENKEVGVRDAIAKDRVDRDPVTNKEVIITGGGEVLCYDSITGRYFQSTVEIIRKAQNDINAATIFDGYASQNDFYDMIGLPATAMGEELGWRTDHMLEVRFSSSLAADGRPCLSIEYDQQPIRDFYKSY